MSLLGGGKEREQKLLNRFSSHTKKMLQKKITRSKTLEMKESSGGITQGKRRTGQDGWVGGSGMKSRAPIPVVNEPTNAVHFPILCSMSEDCSRFYFTVRFDFHWC